MRLEKKIKIKSIDILGFHSEKKRVKCEFASDNVTILYGDNGCGKTTLLQILDAVFSKKDEVLFNYKVKNIDMQLEQNGENIDIQIKRYERERRSRFGDLYDWSQLEHLRVQRTLLLGVDRVNIVANVNASTIYNFLRSEEIFVNKNDNYIRQFAGKLSEYIAYSRKMQPRKNVGNLYADNVVLNGNNLDIENIEDIIIQNLEDVVYTASYNIQSALFSTLSQVISNGDKQDYSDSIKHVEEKLKKFLLLISYSLNRIPENRGNNEILRLIKSKSEDDICKECKENKFLCLVMENIMNSIEREQERFNAIIQLINCFNKYTRKDKRMKIEVYDFKKESNFNVQKRYELIIEIIENEEVIEKHKVTNLSSGEKQLLILLMCLFMDGNSRDFVFIDEPDMSLNIKWQRELVALFKKYNPDTQIIMATHSPAIAENCTECLRKLV